MNAHEAKIQATLRRVKRRADSGDVAAQLEMATILLERPHVEMQKAWKYIFKAMKQRNEAALSLFGDVFVRYPSSIEWTDEILSHLLYGAEMGVPSCQCGYGLAMMGLWGTDEGRVGMDMLKKAADSGYAIAQREYALSLHGDVDREDEMLNYLEMAIDQGDVGSQYYMGAIHQMGLSDGSDLSEAIRWYRVASDEGHHGAQSCLGYMLIIGLGTDRNLEEGIRLLNQSIRQGNPQAMCNLGALYERGVGVNRDYNKAIELYNKAGERGVATAKYNLSLLLDFAGMDASNKREISTMYLMESASCMCISAQVELICRFSKVKSLCVDPNDVLLALKTATRSGDGHHMFHLGECYMDGVHLEKDMDKALRMYMAAISRGCLHAELALEWAMKNGLDINGTVNGFDLDGMMSLPPIGKMVSPLMVSTDGPSSTMHDGFDINEFGIDLDADIPDVDAFDMQITFEKIANLAFSKVDEGCAEDANLKDDLGGPVTPMTSSETMESSAAIAQDEEPIIETQDDVDGLDEDDSDKLGHDAMEAEELCRIGILHEMGHDTEINYAKAIELYDMAIGLGSAKAECQLGLMYLDGVGVEADYEKAISLLESASEKGDAKALNTLGTLYDEGVGVEMDKRMAFKLYLRSAKGNYPWGQYNVALCLLQGIGTRKDFRGAKRWLHSAAKQGHEDSIDLIDRLRPQRR